MGRRTGASSGDRAMARSFKRRAALKSNWSVERAFSFSSVSAYVGDFTGSSSIALDHLVKYG